MGCKGALLLALVASLTRLSHAQQDCATSVIDLAFIIDGSGSICDNDPSFTRGTCDNWASVQEFIKNAVRELGVGPDNARLAFVLFSNNGVLIANLNQYSTTSDIEALVDREILFPGGNTNTYEGMNVAIEQIFCDGCTGNRPDVRNVAIVITDGLPTRNIDLTIPEGQRLQGVATVFSLGVTDSVDPDTLRGIATGDVENTNWFRTPDFKGLEAVLESLLQVACAATPAPPTTGCSTSVIDLAFVVDGSGSICDNDPLNDRNVPGCPNWNLVLGFISEAVTELSIGVNDAHVALIMFANDGITQWDLSTYSDKGALLAAVNSLAYPGGNTNTQDALLKLESDIFNGQASSGDRFDVQNVAIVITDGIPTIRPENTEPVALRLQNADVLMFSVGVTNAAQQSTLEYLSSDPRVEGRNWFAAADFSDLQSILDSLLVVACVTSTQPPPPSPGCAREADVVFIVDASGSIGDRNFETMRQALNDIVFDLDVDSGRVRVAIIRFSDNAELLADLTAFSSRAQIQEFIQNMRYVRGTTNTASALDMALSQVFSQNGDRTNVDNYAVILTDGGSNDKRRTIESAINAKRIMTVLTIGIGDWTDTYELRAIASDPDSINYWEQRRFDDLRTEQFRDRLRNFLCNNENECSSNPCQNGGVCVDMANRFICRCPSNYGGDRCQYFCRTPADVVFALDASGSIGKANFLRVITFAKAVVRQLPVGEGTRVGMLTYGDTPQKYFDLRDYNDMEGTMNAMTIPYFSGGTTNTAGALRTFRDSMFTTSAGDTNAPDVGVVITDGRSNDMSQTWLEARADRDDDIQLLAVGVGGNTRDAELRSIASYPTNNNVFKVDDFASLDNIIDTVRDSICDATDECNPNPCGNNGQCRDLRNGYYCICRTGFTGQNCERRCGGELDVLYIVDRSGSIRHERFEEVKEMIAETVSELETWQGKVRVAGISFSDDARVEFQLDSYTHKQDIMEAIRRIAYSGGRTNIASALQMAREEIFRQDRGDRQDVKNLIVIFTDGGSNIRDTETIPQAITDKITGIQIIVAAVGRDLNLMELRGIASNPYQNNIFSVDSFSRINDLKSNIVQGTCNDQDDCAPRPCQNGGTCVDDYYSYVCVCPSDRTGQNCERRCSNRQYDVLFILDLSGSVNQVYDISIVFIKQIVYGLEFRFGRSRAALISFADDAQVDFFLNTHEDQRDILTAIAFTRAGGRTNTQAALQLARDEVFQGRNGDRSGVQDRVFIMTDGGSNINPTNTIPNANDLKNRNMEITVVAIGDQVDINEVNAMASGNGEPYVYRVSTEDQAMAAASRKLDDMCS